MEKIFKITLDDSYKKTAFSNIITRAINEETRTEVKVEEIDLNKLVENEVAKLELVNVPELNVALDYIAITQDFEKIIEKHCVPGTNGICNYEKAATEIYAYLVKNQPKEENEWISINDRLPIEQKYYIVCDDDNEIYEAFYDGLEFEKKGYGIVDNITHWREKPKPPEKKS